MKAPPNSRPGPDWSRASPESLCLVPSKTQIPAWSHIPFLSQSQITAFEFDPLEAHQMSAGRPEDNLTDIPRTIWMKISRTNRRISGADNPVDIW